MDCRPRSPITSKGRQLSSQGSNLARRVYVPGVAKKVAPDCTRALPYSSTSYSTASGGKPKPSPCPGAGAGTSPCADVEVAKTSLASSTSTSSSSRTTVAFNNPSDRYTPTAKRDDRVTLGLGREGGREVEGGERERGREGGERERGREG